MKLKSIITFTLLLSMCSGSVFATKGKGEIKGTYITFNKVQIIDIYLIPVLLPFNFAVGCPRESKIVMRDVEVG
jgi:hypothetical protein